MWCCNCQKEVEQYKHRCDNQVHSTCHVVNVATTAQRHVQYITTPCDASSGKRSGSFMLSKFNE